MTLLEFYEANANALLVIVFGGLALLGAGYLAKGPRSHDLRIAGWVVFGLYWPTQIAHYLELADPTNATFCAIAPLFTGYIAWHEWKSRQWGEDPVALRWLAGSVFIAATTYFTIYKIPAVTDALIQFTTWQSALAVEHVFRVPATYGQDAFGNWNIYINGTDYAVTVILACTAVQSMMIFVGAIACIKAPWAAKWKAMAVSVLPIYFLNLLRNAGIVYGYKVLAWNPFGWGPVDHGGIWYKYFPTESEGAFVWMHSYVGKYGSLLALVGIALAVFTILPELHSAILDVFDLRKRHRPGFFAQPDAKGVGRASPGGSAPSNGGAPAPGAKPEPQETATGAK